MDFSAVDLTIQGKIEMLQRWILIHSTLYYEMDESIVSDFMFDSNCKQLYNMIVKYPEAWRNAKYTYAMKDFDGATGFGFMQKLNKEEYDIIMRNLAIVIDINRKSKELLS